MENFIKAILIVAVIVLLFSIIPTGTIIAISLIMAIVFAIGMYMIIKIIEDL